MIQNTKLLKFGYEIEKCQSQCLQCSNKQSRSYDFNFFKKILKIECDKGLQSLFYP